MTFKLHRASLALTFLLSLFSIVASLQVSPDSPCTEFCIDEPDLDASDPDSSNTQGSDITCSDAKFRSDPKGQKFQRCLTCLQDSAYSWGTESDQQWFFYNMRYSVDYCVLGLPNTTDIESSPCVTSEACGRLESALTDGLMDPAYAEPYDYCKIDSGSLTSDKMQSCQSCVRAIGDRSYLSNFITAIQAGCEQQPGAGVIVGLSDTVFTTSTLTILSPSSSSSSDSSSGPNFSPPIIAGVAIGSFVLVLLIAGCVFMQVRKRKNRQARLKRASPLSFRCQTHVTPRTPHFPAVIEEEEEVEKSYIDPSAALRSNPVNEYKSSPVVGISMALPPLKPVAPSHSFVSPVDQYKTPTSTTSTRSNMPLLASSYKPYIPSEYTSPPNNATPGLAISTPEVSPYIDQGPPNSGLRIATKWGGLGSSNMRSSPTSPVSLTHIQTSFPPPPSPKKRRG